MDAETLLPQAGRKPPLPAGRMKRPEGTAAAIHLGILPCLRPLAARGGIRHAAPGQMTRA